MKCPKTNEIDRETQFFSHRNDQSLSELPGLSSNFSFPQKLINQPTYDKKKLYIKRMLFSFSAT